jgi:hypothetical protein
VIKVKALSRKNFLKAQKTLSFAAGGEDNVVISGQFNQLNMSLRGTFTTGGAGAVAGKDILEAIARLQITSNKYGVIGDMNGAEIYYLSRQWFGSAAFSTAGTAASTANVGYEASLPVTCDHDETLTITVTWVAALTSIVTDATGYNGVLRFGAEIMSVNPEMKFAFRHMGMGASGVIGANSSYDHAPIPQVGSGFQLMGFIAETNTTARGTLTNALTNIRLTAGLGNYIIDENATLLQHTFAVQVPITIITGVYGVKFYPFPHGSDTVLTLTAGAAATVIGSQILFVYTMITSTEKVEPMPGGAVQTPIEQNTTPQQPGKIAGSANPQQAAQFRLEQRSQGITSLFNVPDRSRRRQP